MKTCIYKDVEKSESSYPAGGNVNGASVVENSLAQFLRRLNKELPDNPAPPLIGIYPRQFKT